jgi:hypothetical protein
LNTIERQREADFQDEPCNYLQTQMKSYRILNAEDNEDESVFHTLESNEIKETSEALLQEEFDEKEEDVDPY